ncbi:hypothetical protein [Streptomyces syringium]|uniref:hypothetical protein n=1 Tax=Streptomyces syringium TaxID=76729 RepID=UPI003449C218
MTSLTRNGSFGAVESADAAVCTPEPAGPTGLAAIDYSAVLTGGVWAVARWAYQCYSNPDRIFDALASLGMHGFGITMCLPAATDPVGELSGRAAYEAVQDRQFKDPGAISGEKLGELGRERPFHLADRGGLL